MFKRLITAKFFSQWMSEWITFLFGGWEKFKRLTTGKIFSQWRTEWIAFLLVGKFSHSERKNSFLLTCQTTKKFYHWDMLGISNFPSLNIKQMGWFFYWSKGKWGIENLLTFWAFLSFLSCISAFPLNLAFSAALLWIFYIILSGFSCLLWILVQMLCIYIVMMAYKFT